MTKITLYPGTPREVTLSLQQLQDSALIGWFAEGGHGAEAVLRLLDYFAPRNAPEDAPREDGTVRKAHYGSGVQPWDTMLACGWAPEFAAGCVIRYLRRTKEPEHSLASARWYYVALQKLAVADAVAARRFGQLNEELTAEERIKLIAEELVK